MQIQTIQLNKNNYKIHSKPQHKTNSHAVSFKAVKGLGDPAKNLFKMAESFVISTKEGQQKYGKIIELLNKDYLEAVALKSEEKMNAVIEKIKNLRQEFGEFVHRKAVEGKIISDKVGQEELEVFKHTPIKGFGFGKIAGYDDIKDILNREFIDKIKQERQGKKVDIPGVFAFFGPRGNGKTTSTRAIAEETGCCIEEISLSRSNSVEKNFEKLVSAFKESKQNFNKDGRRIIFLDEFTKFCNEGVTVKNDFINLLKDCSKKFHCTFFGTTNNLSLAGDKFMALKPVLVAYEPATKYNAIQILKHYVGEAGSSNIRYSEVADEIFNLAKQYDGVISNSRLRALVNKAKEKAEMVDTEDLIQTAREYINEKYIIKPEVMTAFKTDYEKYMK